MARVGIVTLGCAKNTVDAEIMAGLLRREGHELVARAEDAEVVVVNTCSFIDASRKESVERIVETAALKETGACRMLAVTGCLAQRYAGELREALPEVDLFVGTGEFHRLPRLIAEGLGEEREDAEVAVGPPRWLQEDLTPRLLSGPSYSAYLKVSEGCSRPCAFCIIPRLRGPNRSRGIESVVREAEGLAAQGARELNLIAQDLTDFRKDAGEPLGLERLLARLARVEGLRWVRCLYLYPDGITDELVRLLSEEERLCRYADMPVQHVSDPVLRAMRRAGGEKQVRASVEKLRAAGVSVRSTAIVGFPGETEADFRRLLDYVGEGHFDHLGVFPYSDEEGTKAFDLPGRLPKREKEARRRALMRRQREVSLAKHRALVGRTLEVLCEGESEETELLLKGRLETQAPEIDGQVLLRSGTASAGEFVRVRIVEAHPYDLVGEIEEEALAGRERFPIL